ncbi:MAG: D-alanine--D-alanine ligase A [Legionellales bacterium]|nr:D-alanine--D-alanine ligase A [Legionellales bacterium]
MHHKLRIGILFGGQSAEHNISIMSAFNVIKALDQTKYDIVLVGIDRDGKMYLQKLEVFTQPKPPEAGINKHIYDQVTLIPGNGHGLLVNLLHKEEVQILDVIFPVLHGPYGEDGTIQGLIKTAGIPCVGASVLSSAICMDKDIAKRLLLQAGLPTPESITLHKYYNKDYNADEIIKKLGLPCFVKPANLGSSIGITKVTSKEMLEPAISNAFFYDKKIIIETFIDGREIECAVLGNYDLMTSLPGEIKLTKDYYSYEAKYFDAEAAEVIVVAELDEKIQTKIQSLAKDVFKCLECEGMARVDFFLTKKNKIYVNEVNTLPGFTHISQYPKMCEAAGINISDLLDKLVQLAIESFKETKQLKTVP